VDTTVLAVGEALTGAVALGGDAVAFRALRVALVGVESVTLDGEREVTELERFPAALPAEDLGRHGPRRFSLAPLGRALVPSFAGALVRLDWLLDVRAELAFPAALPAGLRWGAPLGGAAAVHRHRGRLVPQAPGRARRPRRPVRRRDRDPARGQ
jgi:hypothetical protein